MSDVYVLDSFAVLAFLGNEPGSEEVLTVLREAQEKTVRLLMTWVNVGEVAYVIERRWGKEKVYQTLGMLEATEIVLVEVGRELALRAAEIKAEIPMAYTDALAAALAMREDAVLLTGDPEFEPLVGAVDIHWLRRRMES